MVAIFTFLGAVGAVLLFLWVGLYLLKKRQKKREEKYLQINVFSLLVQTSQEYSFISLIEKFDVRPIEMKTAINNLKEKGLVKKVHEHFVVTEFGEMLFSVFLKGKEDGIENFL